MSAGLRLVAGDPILRPIAVEAAVYNLFETAILTLLVLFATLRLGLTAGLLGAILALGATGSVADAVAVERHESRWRVGRTMVIGLWRGVSLAAVDPARRWSVPIAASILVLALVPIATAVVRVYVWSLRQSLVPPDMLGRMNAAYRSIVSGMLPLGALLGGALGSWLGLRGEIAVAAGGMTLAIAPVLASPIPRLARIPGLTPGKTTATSAPYVTTESPG